MWGLVSKLMMTAFSQRLQFPSYPTQELLFQQFGPKQINPRHPRGTPWSLPYSWQSEVLDLAQMVMTIRKQHKMTSFIIPNNYCFNKLAQKSILGIQRALHGHCPTPGSRRRWTSPRWSWPSGNNLNLLVSSSPTTVFSTSWP